MSAVVFLGPSLPLDEAQARLRAAYLPPAARGDVYRAVRDRAPRILVLIDGHFRERPAVWHRELLWAMAQGVHVLGAASMGALRAAELGVFGMRGIGRIFEAYRDGRYAPYADAFEDDAEVAVVHGPAELGSRPLTVALVDVRDVLARRWRRGRISAAARDAVLGAARDIHFAERSVERLTARARDALRGDEAAAALDAIARGPSRKALDARAALDAAGRLLASGAPAPRAGFTLEPALVWERFRRATDRADRPAIAALRDVAGATRVTTWPPRDRISDTPARVARAGAGHAKAPR